MTAIKSCLKNLLINIKYYFVPLGIAMFFIIIGISVGIPVILNSIQETFNGIAARLEHVSFDWTSALNKIVEIVIGIPQTDGVNTVIETVSNKDWIVNTLTSVAWALFGDSISTQEIVTMIASCAQTIAATIALIVSLAMVGFVISFFVIMVAVRKSITKSGWIKSIFFSLVDTLLFAFLLWVYSLIGPLPLWLKILITIVYIFATVAFSFIESYVFYGIKKLKFREVLNIKNILFWGIGNILTLILGAAFALIPFFLVPWAGGIILAIPFVEIVLLVIHMNSEGYIKELATSKRKEAKAEKLQKKEAQA